jgi:hypothetical protein
MGFFPMYVTNVDSPLKNEKVMAALAEGPPG